MQEVCKNSSNELAKKICRRTSKELIKKVCKKISNIQGKRYARILERNLADSIQEE